MQSHLEEQLIYIQCRLQELNSHIATPEGVKARKVQFDVEGAVVRRLEGWIDEFDAKLPPLTTFILPVPLLLSGLDDLMSSRVEWRVHICMWPDLYAVGQNGQCMA